MDSQKTLIILTDASRLSNGRDTKAFRSERYDMRTTQPQEAGIHGRITSDLDTPEAAYGKYSNLQVLQSAAGYYVGTLYEEFSKSGEVLYQVPGSRESGYFATAAIAETVLATM